MEFQVVFYRTSAGNQPVLEWLRKLDADERRIIGEDLRTVQLGWPLGMPLCRSLGGGLYEIRSHLAANGRIARLVFFLYGNTIVVVEGFIKKTQTTPDTVLKQAGTRKREYERNVRGSMKRK